MTLRQAQRKFNRIFVTGMFRSGTTLLARALGAHEEISFASDPYFEFFKFVRNKFYRKGDTNFDPESPISDKFLEDASLHENFAKDFWEIELEIEDLADIKRRIENAAKDYSPRIIPLLKGLERENGVKAVELLEQLIGLIPRAYPSGANKIIGFKEVWLEEFIGPLLDENFGVAHIIRDPRAVVASNKKSRTGRYPILFLIRQWRKSAAFSILNREREKYYLTIFENLIQNPEKEFKKMCEALGIPFSVNLLDVGKYKDGSGQPWVQNSSFGGKAEFDDEAIHRWKEVLSEEETRLIELLCAPEFLYFGYVPSQELSLAALNEYSDPREDLADWIKKYDFDLSERKKEQELIRLFAWQHPELKWEDKVLRQLFISKEVYEELKI